MATTTFALPAPAANGSGAAVNVATLGGDKTIVVDGSGDAFVLIEVANDLAGANWSPLTMFLKAGTKTLPVACRWMRATVKNYQGDGAPTVSVGGDNTGTEFANLPVPLGNGNGAGVDTALLPFFKTIQVSGTYRGTVNIEVSNDGGATYSLVTAFQSNRQGAFNGSFTADFMRVRRTGIPAGASAGLPVINVGAASTDGSGGDQPNATNFVFVYNPFGPAVDNVYNDFSTLEAAMNEVNSFKVLQFDNTRRGFGDAISVPAALPIQRIHDAAGGFSANMVGRAIMIDGDHDFPANNGSFTITTFIDAFNIEYSNAQAGAAANPGFDGTWVVLGSQYVPLNVGGGAFVAAASVVTFTPTIPGLFTADMDYATITITGATTPANNGSFTLRFIDANSVSWVNTAGVTEALGPGGTFQVFLTGCRIPAREQRWNMLQTEWMGYVAPYAAAGMGGVRVDVVDGCGFANLRKISSEINLLNHNMVPSLAPVVVNQPIIFEFGMGPMGDFPQINNPGTQAFFDCSGLAPGLQMTIRLAGYLLGPNPTIEMGNSQGGINTALLHNAKFTQNSIRGTHPAAIFNVAQRNGLNEIDQQTNVITAGAGVIAATGFAGTVNYGSQNTNQGPNVQRRLWTTFPQSLNQGIPTPRDMAYPPSINGGLGHNTANEITSDATVDQPLPKIRDFSLAGGTQSPTPGALNSTGMENSWKQCIPKNGAGTGTINLFGESPILAQNAAATLVNTAGGAFAVAAGVVTFTSVDALFTSAMVGRAITIAGATTIANNGTYLITSFIDASNVTWVNAAAFAEALPAAGTWRVGDTIDGLAVVVVVPAGGAKTLISDGVSNWRLVADVSPPGVPTTPARVLDTPFAPNTLRHTLGMYTVELICDAGESMSVQLVSDAANPPVTVRAEALLAVVGAGDADTVRQELTYLVPPGHFVSLVTAGTGVATIERQCEIALF